MQISPTEVLSLIRQSRESVRLVCSHWPHSSFVPFKFPETCLEVCRRGARVEYVLTLDTQNGPASRPSKDDLSTILEKLQSYGVLLRVIDSKTMKRVLPDSVGDFLLIDDEVAIIAKGSPIEYHTTSNRTEIRDLFGLSQQLFNYAAVLDYFQDASQDALEGSDRSKVFQFSHRLWDDLVRQLSAQPDLLYSVPSRDFEELVAELLTRDGLHVQLTPAIKDGGRDVLAFLDTPLGRLLFLVECKRYSRSRPVDVSIVRQLYGVVEAERASAGLIVTTSYFTREAITFSKGVQHRMSLKDYSGLVGWIKQRFRAANTGPQADG